ncbi:DUF1905 domain-containing protein [Propionibacteriaceae bacterium Y1685]|uniref:DUF1905 domain-containing protein n=1 Tax=Microlunatus sp. Y1700 TaxID=3418487 RepID=UPI003B792662
MEFTFTGEVWHWRGPAPFHYVTVPEEVSGVLLDLAQDLSYGWGMIPGTLTIGGTTWYTALFPKDGGHVVPIKTAVRRAEGIELGDEVTITLSIAA